MATAMVLGSFLVYSPALATPPEYKSFGREQKIDFEPSRSEVVRIWMVYVGDGEGLVIQLPERFSRKQSGHQDQQAEKREPVEIIVDGGSFRSEDAERMLHFLERLLPFETIRLEHAVITHHESDHVRGLVRILQSPTVGIEHVYHNGLAEYAPGARGIPRAGRPVLPGVYDYEARLGRVSRALGLSSRQSRQFFPVFVMDDEDELEGSIQRGELFGSYLRFATTLLRKHTPFGIKGFHRVRREADFIGEIEGTEQGQALAFEVLGPTHLSRFGEEWKPSVAGNSVTFRLRYRDFGMLFTGDHHRDSQQALLDTLQPEGQVKALEADVLKVPNHGSEDCLKEFVEAVSPVISVTSQGELAARPNKYDKAAARPSPRVISWLGGAHRVYSTQIHERVLDWEHIESSRELERYRERSHILIETDGYWFRVVEVPLNWPNLSTPPFVHETTRSDGTRWIRAK